MTNVWNPTPPAATIKAPARLALNAVAPAGLMMAANAVLMLFGAGADLPRFENLAVAPPDWVNAVVWILVLVALGLSRFELLRSDDGETLAIDALLVAAMVYPFTASAFGAEWMAANTLTLLAMAIMAFVAACPLSRKSAGWLAPVIGWLAWTSWLSVAHAAAG